MRNVEVYIKDINDLWIRLDLFDYETIDITNSIQDIKEIGKVFTDFSKEFDVPASSNNNKVFKHYYNPDIDGFDARFKLDALIKIDGIDYRKGKISLLGSSLHNYMAKSYQIVFYGETVALSDLLGDDMLKNITTPSVNNHSFTLNTNFIKESFEYGKKFNGTSLVSVVPNEDDFDLCFPFISASSFYFYDADVNGINPRDNVDSRNVYEDAFNTSSAVPRGVHYDDLKPALRVDKIIKGIEERYGIQFSNDFFNSTNKTYYDLFLWLQRESGTLSKQIDTKQFDFPLTDFGFAGDTEQRQGSDLGELEFRVVKINNRLKDVYAKQVSFRATTDIVTSGCVLELRSDVTEYNQYGGLVREEKDNLINTFTFNPVNGVNELNFSYTFEEQAGNSIFGKTIIYRPTFRFIVPSNVSNVEIEDPITIYGLEDGVIQEEGSYDGREGSNALVNDEALFTQLSDYMPKIKVIDFLQGLFKMFNLTAYYDGTEIVVKTLDSYYESGNEYNLTKYTDTSSTEVKRNDLYSEIDFKFAKASTFAAQKANEIQEKYIKREFGNERLNVRNIGEGSDLNLAFDGGKYEVKLPFEKVMYEKMIDQDTEQNKAVQWGWFCSKDENPVLGKPLLFYPIKRGKSIRFDENVKYDNNNWNSPTGNYDGSKTEMLDYYIRPSNSVSDYSQSLNFGSEFDEFTQVEQPNSLFANYWSNYISNIYNVSSRIFTMSAYLPTHILTNLKLNDVVVIGNRKYRINKLEVNLNNGKAKLELFNDLGYYD